MQDKRWGNEYRTTVVCIDRYENGVPSGRFYNPCLSAGERFQSLIELLKKLDWMLDRMKFPQSFTAERSFAPQSEQIGAEPPDEELHEGKAATFAVRIIFRQNASWQGSVSWLEGRREQGFRSALELIFLMDSALSEGKQSGPAAGSQT